MDFTGTVVDVAGQKSEWFGYKVTAELVELYKLEPDDEAIPTPVEISSDVAPTGAFSVAIPELAAIQGDVVLKVLAPAGEILSMQTVPRDALGQGVRATVTPRAVFEIPRASDPFKGEKPKLQGRAIDFEGRRQIANRQVIIYGITEANRTPIVIARTDGQGYFSADYPRTSDPNTGAPAGPLVLSRAVAIVAGTHDASGGVEIPISLTSLYGAQNVLPRSVILVVKLDDDPFAATDGKPSDCDCVDGVPRAPDAVDLAASSAYSTDLGGKCVNLNVPNRAVEEYSYFTVVRTTDPEIVGTNDGSIPTAPPERVRNVLATMSNLRSALQPREPLRAVLSVPAPQAKTPINTALLSSALNKKGVDLDAALDDAVLASEVAHARTMLKKMVPRPAGRTTLNARNRIRWDDDVKFYEATSIAHGHLLQFKQTWRADGYSLGDLLYSLPLAPGQKKQIAVVDWERRETARRDESVGETESLTNLLERDRDISEIVNVTFGEQMHGESTSLTLGAGHGSGAAGSGSSGGFNIGAVGGTAMGGGYSKATADQNAARDLVANAMQKIRDKTFQAASAVRNRRSTVVQTVAQGEAVTVTTEVIANHNHCHAMTVEYFEVLRHFVVSQQLANVTECLYVPLEMAPFTREKALRWRDQLERFLRKPALAPAFDALQRIQDGASDLPAGRFADEEVRSISGSLTMLVRVPKNEPGLLEEIFSKVSRFLFGSRATGTSTNAHLQMNAMKRGAPQGLPLSFTILSDFKPDVPLAVSIFPSEQMPAGLTRADIEGISLSWNKDDTKLPEGSALIIKSVHLRYRTAHLDRDLFADHVVNASLEDEKAYIDTPMTASEMRNPHKEDEAAEKKLLAHLNEHLEYYHKAIWWGMDPDRRFMLLDGFLAPNANGRSVASVVENRLIGFVGNSMILPVGFGIHLDPTYKEREDGEPVSLLDMYGGADPIPPVRVSVPTRGVYAEAVMGACNACEEKDETRLWRWDEAPIDEPTAIASPTTDSRKSAAPDLAAQPFSPPMINIQNAPAAPDPTGLSQALKVIATPGIFPNITGLDQTQKNSLEALKSSLEAAKYFGGEASKLAQQAAMQKGGIDKSLQSISQAQKAGMISGDQGNQLAMSALKGLVGGGAGATETPKKSSVEELVPSLKGQLEKGGVKSLKAETAGDTIQADFAQPELILASNTTTTTGTNTPKAPPAEVANWPLGVDVSRHQPLNDASFAALARAGKKFVIVKATQGRNPKEATFDDYYARTKSHGMLRGSYHFFGNPFSTAWYGGTIAQQTQGFLGAVKRCAPGDLAPALDLEDEPRSASFGALDTAQGGRYPLDQGVVASEHGYAYRTSNAGRQDVLADVQRFLDRIETAVGRTPIIYTSSMWMDSDMLRDPTVMSQYPLWTVYHEARTRPKLLDISVGGWGKDWAFVQYAEQGKRIWGMASYDEPGLSIPGLDFNAYKGTIYGLRGLADLGRTGVAVAAGVLLVLHLEIDGTMHLLVNAGGTWTDTDLTNQLLATSLGDPAAFGVGDVLFAYARSNDHIIEFSRDIRTGGAWSSKRIDGAAPTALHDPRAIADATRRFVTWVATDDHAYLLTFDGAWTDPVDVTSVHGIPAATGPAVPYLHQGVVHVVGRAGPDGHLFDAWVDGADPKMLDLTEAARAVEPAVPAATYAPTVLDVGGQAVIVFRGLRGSLWAIDRATSQPVDLMAAANATVIPQGNPTSFVLGGVPHVVYRGQDGMLYDVSRAGGAWTVTQLPCRDTAASDPTSTLVDGDAVVAVRTDTADGLVHVARLSGGVWTCAETVSANVARTPVLPSDDDPNVVFA
jgi:GH25 family lysozyme M1 (1,4-beta-N-acetylmuramidase)